MEGVSKRGHYGLAKEKPGVAQQQNVLETLNWLH
jgi:hypothetical protein